MAGDWRLTVTLPQHADAEDFMEWLSVNLPEGDVTRDGPRIHVYADDPRGVKYVEHVVATMCDELETPAYVVVDRWNPGDEAWQPPGIPVEEPEPPPPDPVEVDLGAAEVEVLLRSPEALPDDLVERLQREGIAVFSLGGRRLWAPAPDAWRGEEIAERLRLEAPSGSAVEVRPLTRWLRWHREQQLGLGSWGGGG
jgi:hypothetical protein